MHTVFTDKHTYIHRYIHTHTYIHKPTYTYTYTYMDTYTQKKNCNTAQPIQISITDPGDTKAIRPVYVFGWGEGGVWGGYVCACVR